MMPFNAHKRRRRPKNKLPMSDRKRDKEENRRIPKSDSKAIGLERSKEPWNWLETGWTEDTVKKRKKRNDDQYV